MTENFICPRCGHGLIEDISLRETTLSPIYETEKLFPMSALCIIKRTFACPFCSQWAEEYTHTIISKAKKYYPEDIIKQEIKKGLSNG